MSSSLDMDKKVVSYTRPRGEFTFEKTPNRIRAAYQFCTCLCMILCGYGWFLMMRPVHTTITGRFDKITASLLVLLIFSQLYIWKQTPKSSSPFLTKNSGAKELLVGALCQIMALIMTFLGAVPWKNEIWAVVVVTAPTTLAIYAHFVMIRGLTGRPHVTGFVQYHDVPGLGAEKEEPTRREVV